MKRVLASLLSWCLGISITVACIRNVFSANLALEQMAKETACGARPGCSAQMTQFMRTPIERTYVFVTSAGKVEVRCMREFVLFGDYACKDGASGVSGHPSA